MLCHDKRGIQKCYELKTEICNRNRAREEYARKTEKE